MMLIAAIVLLVAGGAFLAWTKMHSSGTAVATSAASAGTTTAATHPSLPTSSGSDAQIISPEITAAPSPLKASSTTSGVTPAKPSPEKTASAAAVETKAAKSTDAKSAPADAAETAPEPERLMVQGGRMPSLPPTPPPSADPDAPTIDVSSDNSASAISGLVSSGPVNVPKPSGQSLQVSQGVSQGLLVKKVSPVYPRQALQSHIEGAVLLLATIGQDGSIADVKVLKGDPILTSAATDAVKQWKYKPYYLDGQPVEIQTQITLNFKLP